MTVISRNRAEEFYFVQFAPWGTSHNTVCHSTCHGIKHNIQTGIAINQNVSFRHFRHICQQFSCITDTIQNAIISAVNSVRTYQIHFTVQNIHQSITQIQLSFGRFTSGHIQFQSFCLYIFKLFFQITFQCQ